VKPPVAEAASVDFFVFRATDSGSPIAGKPAINEFASFEVERQELG
jgi:hypothetical protein